jgi:ubiquinone/menaquinone biosynthesis C-methylase UbiE
VNLFGEEECMSKAQLKRAEAVNPFRFVEDLYNAGNTYALIAAVELDVFTVIAQGHKTATEIARAIQVPQRGLERLLDAVVGLGYLTKKGSQYGLTPLSDTFLVRGRDSYMGDERSVCPVTIPGWAQLADVIRTGKPVVTVDAQQGREFFPQLVRAIFPGCYYAARALVRRLPQAQLKRIHHVLDVAAGSAAWSLPFAQALPNVRVTAVDYPEVTPVAREFAQKFGVADRYDYLEGDLRQLDFGQKAYDMVILGHIIHSEGAEWGKNLIQKSHRALKPGGTLAIAEAVPNDNRTGPLFPLLFALNMILLTSEGDVFTMAQYRRWLNQTGFTNIRAVDIPHPSPFILATR